MLKEKLDELGVEVEYLDAKYLEEIGDCLPELLEEEEIENHFDGDILTINNGKAEVAYVKIYDKIWLVCYMWIPLWNYISCWNCMPDDLKKGDEYYASPYDFDEDNNENRGRKALEAIGFAVGDSEGF